jgi:hypothetical protein
METECASCEVRTGLYVLLQVASISQLTVSWLSRQCGILNISQPYRSPWPVTGIALLFYLRITYLFSLNYCCFIIIVHSLVFTELSTLLLDIAVPWNLKIKETYSSVASTYLQNRAYHNTADSPNIISLRTPRYISFLYTSICTERDHL